MLVDVYQMNIKYITITITLIKYKCVIVTIKKRYYIDQGSCPSLCTDDVLPY